MKNLIFFSVFLGGNLESARMIKIKDLGSVIKKKF